MTNVPLPGSPVTTRKADAVSSTELVNRLASSAYAAQVAPPWSMTPFGPASDQRPGALSAAEVQAALGRGEPVSSDEPDATSPSPSAGDMTDLNGAEPGADAKSGAPPTTSRAQVSTTSIPTTSTTSHLRSTATLPSDTRTNTTTTVTTFRSTSPSTTTTVQSQAETRTYNTVGGSATIRFEPGRVSLVSATPAVGFGAQLVQEMPTELYIRFQSESHESKIEAKWENGPRDSVEEESQTRSSSSS